MRECIRMSFHLFTIDMRFFLVIASSNQKSMTADNSNNKRPHKRMHGLRNNSCLVEMTDSARLWCTEPLLNALLTTAYARDFTVHTHTCICSWVVYCNAKFNSFDCVCALVSLCLTIGCINTASKYCTFAAIVAFFRKRKYEDGNVRIRLHRETNSQPSQPANSVAHQKIIYYKFQ